MFGGARRYGARQVADRISLAMERLELLSVHIVGLLAVNMVLVLNLMWQFGSVIRLHVAPHRQSPSSNPVPFTRIFPDASTHIHELVNAIVKPAKRLM